MRSNDGFWTSVLHYKYMCANTHPPLLIFTAFLKGIWIFTSTVREFLEKGHFFRNLSPIGFPEIWVGIPLASEASSRIFWVAEVPACEWVIWGAALLRCTLSCQTAQHKSFTGPQIPGHQPIPGQRMTPSLPPMAHPKPWACPVTRTPCDTAGDRTVAIKNKQALWSCGPSSPGASWGPGHLSTAAALCIQGQSFFNDSCVGRDRRVPWSLSD